MLALLLASCRKYDQVCRTNGLVDAVVIVGAVLAAVGVNLWWFWYRRRGR
jgi:hypothetical protein